MPDPTRSAVGFTNFGPPDVLRPIDVTGEPLTETEVRVEVAVATVNPTDSYLRSGRYASTLARFAAPWIPGMEAAGTVTAVGPGVEAVAVGDRVAAVTTPLRTSGGAYRRSLVVDATSVCRLPDRLSFAQAAPLAMNGLTALRALDVLDLPPGASLGVTGAAGVVGSLVAQLATEADLDVQRWSRDNGVTRAPVDGLIDAAAIGPSAWAPVRGGGAVATLRPFEGSPREDLITHPVAVSDYLQEAWRLAPLLEAAADGTLSGPEVVVFHASDAAAAHRSLEQRSRPRPLLLF